MKTKLLLGLGALAVTLGVGAASLLANGPLVDEKETIAADQTSTVIYVTDKGWSEFKVRAWNNGSENWDYHSLSSTGFKNSYGETVMRCDLGAKYDNIQFRGRPEGWGGYGYTTNITWTSGKNAFWIGDQIEFTDTFNWGDYSIENDIYLYDPNERFGSTPYAHMWNGHGGTTWPGTSMTKVDGHIFTMLSFEFLQNVIFNNGSNASQTGDLDIPAIDSENKCYNAATETWISLDNAKADDFVKTYMAMESTSANQCLTLYPLASGAYSQLTTPVKEILDSSYASAMARYQAWKAAYEAQNANQALSIAGIGGGNNSALLFGGLAFVGVAAAGTMIFFTRKRKDI